MLTAKQKELLLYIHERIKETGVSPSFDEMKEALIWRPSPASTGSSRRSRSVASCAACPTGPARWKC
jgi:hypothetical protein